MRPACVIAATVLDEIAGFIRPGVTTRQVDNFAAERIKAHRAKSAFLGYRKFPSHTCLSVNDEVVHGIASERELKFGDIVSVDVGVAYLPRPDGAKGGVVIGGASLWITNTGTPEQQAGSWDFIKFAAQPEIQAYWSSNTGYYPIRKAAYYVQEMKDTLAKYPQFQVAVEQLRATEASPATAGAAFGTFVSARQNIEAAMEQFMASAGMAGEAESPPPDMNPEAMAVVAEAMARTEPNLDFFLGHYLLPVTSYVPDFAALKAGATRVLAGVGEASVGQETFDTALALAERLGSEAVVFPGDHVGMATHPEAFSETLRETF